MLFGEGWFDDGIEKCGFRWRHSVADGCRRGDCALQMTRDPNGVVRQPIREHSERVFIAEMALEILVAVKFLPAVDDRRVSYPPPARCNRHRGSDHGGGGQQDRGSGDLFDRAEDISGMASESHGCDTHHQHA